MELLGARTRADLTVSGHMGAPTCMVWNPFAVSEVDAALGRLQGSLEAVKRACLGGEAEDGGQVICGQRMETAMTQENARRLHVLSRQLHEHLMSAALCAKEIGDVAQAQGNDGHNGSPRANGNAQSGPHTVTRPLLDEATFSVIWRNKAICLGNTKEFRLLTYLARRANQYVTHLDLLEEVWDSQDKATATIRCVVRHLRRQLGAGGMKELAS